VANPDEPGSSEAASRDRGILRRPLGIVILVAFALFSGVQSLLAAFGVVDARVGSLGSLLTDPVQFQVFSIALGLVYIATGIATWLILRVGWYAMVLLAGLGLLVQITLYVYGSPNFLTMTVGVVTAFYLNQREVKALFLAPRTMASAVVLTREGEAGQP
jgi:hypothetical protein